MDDITPPPYRDPFQKPQVTSTNFGGGFASAPTPLPNVEPVSSVPIQSAPIAAQPEPVVPPITPIPSYFAPQPVAPVALEPQSISEPEPVPETPAYIPETPVFTPPVSEVVPPQTEERVSYADAQIQEIDVTKIIPNPYQPRKVFDPEALKELSDSIREHGVIQPVVVTETETGYELVVGERRFRASVLAGLAKVPAIVKKQLGDQTKLEVALIENIQRRELNPIEEAQAYDRLIKAFNLTQDQVAKKVGKSRPSVTNTLRLLNLPAEIQRAVIEGKLSEGHARAILGLQDSEKQLQLYKLVLEQGLNVRQVEAKVREITMRKSLDAAAPDPKLIALESELRGRLGTQVKIQKQGQGGRITIEFFSEEELSDIMERMREHHENASNGYLTV